MNKQNFSRSLRIQKKNDFLALRQHAKKLVARHWILYFMPNNLNHPRLAITTTARYGNAIVRNRFRRRIRELFRRGQTQLPAFDYHFVAKRNHKAKSAEKVKQELSDDFEKIPALLN